MILAIPITEGKLTQRFGECESYFFVPADREQKRLGKSVVEVAPPHAMHHLPDWIAKKGGEVVIAGAMTERAKSLFEYHGLKVIMAGDLSENPVELAQAWVDGRFDEEAPDEG